MKKQFIICFFISILFGLSLSADNNNPTKEEVTKLYVATFNRAPDKGGVDYWVNSSGLTLAQIGQSFFEQEETKSLYPDGTSIRSFIRSVYLNLFNREPDTGGWDYWEKQLNLGNFTRNRFIEAVINGAQNNENGQDKTILDNKTEVGIYFANAGYGNNHYPYKIMLGITEDSSTVQFIKNLINSGSISYDMWDNYNEVVDLSGYDYIFIYKNVIGNDHFREAYEAFNGFYIQSTTDVKSCSDYGYTTTFINQTVQGVSAKYYYNINNNYTGGCYEIDYAGSAYQGSNNYVMVYNF